MKKFSSIVTAAILGFNSGINYATIGATLTIYLNDFKINYILLGFLSLRMLPYSFKGLWSPVVDILPIRLFPVAFGHRKSWLISMQILLIICYLLLAAFNDIDRDVTIVTIIAIFASFLASTYDNALHGYRMELFRKEAQSKGNSIVALTFKIGFFFSLVSGLVISQYYSWSLVFGIFAITIIPCVFIIYYSREAKVIVKNLSLMQSFYMIKRNYKAPFIAMLKRPYVHYIIIIVMFFKASDSFMDTLLVPYLLDIGFSKVQTAGFSKITGFVSYSIGTIIGGYLLHKKFNILKLMIFTEIFSALTNLGFISFIYIGSNEYILALVSFLESMSSSMCNIVLITFMSYFCKSTLRFSATFYAILQSMSLFARLSVSSFSGVAVDLFGWQYYLIISSLLSIPAILGCYLLLSQPKFGDVFKKIKEARFSE